MKSKYGSSIVRAGAEAGAGAETGAGAGAGTRAGGGRCRAFVPFARRFF